MAKKKAETIPSVDVARQDYMAAVSLLIVEMKEALPALEQVRDGLRFPNEGPDLVAIRDGCNAVFAKESILRSAELIEENKRLRGSR